jgi:hypothetical protein
MSSFRKYFSHHFKETLMRILVITVLVALLTVTFVSLSRIILYDYQPYGHKHPIDAVVSVSGSIGVLGVVAAILSTVIPILELVGFKNRRNMDSLLVLPISRTKMALAHYLNGIIEILFANGVCFALTAIKMIPFADVYSIPSLIPYYLLLMLGSAVVYSVFFFVFMQGNTVADGVIFMTLYSLIGMLVVGTFEALGDVKARDMQFSYCSPYSPIVYVTDLFERFITPNVKYDGSIGPSAIINPQPIKLEWKDMHTFYLVLWCVIGAIAVIGYLYFFSKQRTERIGGISSSPFGYMTLIPIYALSLILLGISGIAGVLVIIATVVGYIIYRRSVRLKLPDLICIGVIAFLIFSGIKF